MDILNFFTSSSDRQWKPFLGLTIATLTILVVGHSLLLLLVDPYDTVPFSPELDRVPVDDIQRIFHPIIAKKQQFDSAIIGNSTIRLLKPQDLNDELNARFANLGMNAATAWEQQQILNIFIKHHPSINTLVIGMDQAWCRTGKGTIKFGDNNRKQQFHEWIYDEQTYNKLPPMNLATIKHSWLQLFAVSGLYTPEFGIDGYTIFTKPMSKYSINRARRHIYGSNKPKQHKPINSPVVFTSQQRQQLNFPEIDQRLLSIMDKLPEDTRKIFMFVPLHAYHQPIAGSKKEVIWSECKQRAAQLAANYKNTFVVDFLIQSALTRRDENYWDYQHYTVNVAEQLARYLGLAINQQVSQPNYQILHPVDKTL